jgi:rod shape determining protein RodA
MSLFDRRLLANTDWPTLGLTLLLCGVGVATIFSATQGTRSEDLYLKQLSFVGLGLLGLLAALVPDYRRLVDRSPLLYGGMLLVLVYTLAFAPRIAGTHRWILLGPLQLQPSEFAKIVVALLVAKLLADQRKDALALRDLLLPGAAVGLVALLVAAAPDLGTAVCLLPALVAVSLLAGLRLKTVVILALALVVVGGLGWRYALRDYQKTRIYTFLDPSLDPRGAGYQKIQSQIAVGSGGLTGKGYLMGSQNQLGYLPARQTDFIFSVLAEELGFVGVALVLALYLGLLWRALDTAQQARDRAGAFLVAGLTATLVFQVVYNVAMVAGLVPVKGLPLPFMSSGGSSMLSSLLTIGLILNVRMRRFVN